MPMLHGYLTFAKIQKSVKSQRAQNRTNRAAFQIQTCLMFYVSSVFRPHRIGPHLTSKLNKTVVNRKFSLLFYIPLGENESDVQGSRSSCIWSSKFMLWYFWLFLCASSPCTTHSKLSCICWTGVDVHTSSWHKKFKYYMVSFHSHFRNFLT